MEIALALFKMSCHDDLNNYFSLFSLVLVWVVCFNVIAFIVSTELGGDCVDQYSFAVIVFHAE